VRSRLRAILPRSNRKPFVRSRTRASTRVASFVLEKRNHSEMFNPRLTSAVTSVTWNPVYADLISYLLLVRSTRISSSLCCNEKGTMTKMQSGNHARHLECCSCSPECREESRRASLLRNWPFQNTRIALMSTWIRLERIPACNISLITRRWRDKICFCYFVLLVASSLTVITVGVMKKTKIKELKSI